MNEDFINMVIECGCEDCKDNKKCNGTDLMNCYAKKKMVIKPTYLHTGAKE